MDLIFFQLLSHAGLIIVISEGCRMPTLLKQWLILSKNVDFWSYNQSNFRVIIWLHDFEFEIKKNVQTGEKKQHL